MSSPQRAPNSVGGQRRQRRQRGFVLVVVIVLVAAISMIVLSQFDVVKSQRGAAIRGTEDAQARAIAETCLERYMASAKDHLTTPGIVDYDTFLDPDGATNLAAPPTGDEYVPSGGTIINIPLGGSAADNADGMRRHAMFLLNGGACLVRFDDNGDDNLRTQADSPPGPLPIFTTSNTGIPPVAEGRQPNGAGFRFFRSGLGFFGSVAGGNDGQDIPFRDRDGAIFITSIGIFPAAAATPAAYAAAHARVTMKRYVTAAVPASSSGAALQAGADVILKENTALCGLGGISSNAVTYEGGGNSTASCACGEVETTVASTFPVECADPASVSSEDASCPTVATCTPGADSTSPQPSPAVPTLAQNTDFLHISGFKNTAGVADVGLNGLPEFYFRDKDAPNPNGGTYEQGPDGTLATGDEYMTLPTQSEVFFWNRKDPVNACSTFSATTVPRPCNWKNVVGDTSADAFLAGAEPVCGAGESPCWKLVARLDGALNPAAAAPGGFLSTGLGEQTVMVGADEYFAPQGTHVNVPFLKGDTAHWHHFENNLCEGSFDCRDGAPAGIPWIGTSTSMIASGNFTIPALTCAGEMPTPAIVILDNPGSEPVFFKEIAGDAVDNAACTSAIESPMQATFLVRNHIYMAEKSNYCCASCLCNSVSFPIAAANCAPAPAVGGLMNPVANSRPLIRANGHCYVKEQTSLVGDLICASVTIKEGNSECVIGHIIGHSNTMPTTTDPFFAAVGGTGTPCSGVMAGCDDADGLGVCIKEGTGFVGSIYSGGDVCIKENTTIFGQVIAADDINIKEGSSIIFSGLGLAAIPGTPTFATAEFIESTW